MSTHASRGASRRVPALAALVRSPAQGLRDLGDQLGFHAAAYRAVPRTVRSYPKEIIRLLAEVSLGSGALALIGGTVLVIGFLTAASGIEVGLQAYTSFDNIGVSALSGFFSAYFNTREVAPIIAGIALTATVGAGFTAQIGAMRVSEEIDAVEVMAVPPIPYLVTTRIIAGLIAVIPLFAIALMSCWLATRVVVTVGYGQASGTYEHYFRTFLRPDDVFWSFVQAIIISVIVMLNHCYYGFYASGGPVGVGEAVGRSMRASLVAIVCVVLFASLALYGVDPNFNLTV